MGMRFGIMERFLDASIQYFGETHACYMMRSRLGWLVKGMPHAGKFRESIKRVASRQEATELIAQYKDQVFAGYSEP